MGTATTATVTGVTGTVVRIVTVTEATEIGMETEIAIATGTGIATVAAATATAVMEMEAGGTEMIGGVTGMGETGGVTEEMIALLSLNHQSVERAGGTTEEKNKHISRIICATNCSMASLPV